MKYSKFNSIISVGKQFSLLYNALSDKYVILKGKANEDIERCGADELRMENNILFEQLIDIQGIVGDSIDETLIVKNIIEDTDSDNSFYHLHINPTLDCNFRCWYCYENHKIGSKMSPNMVNYVQKYIENTIEQRQSIKTFILAFFGGEPLMYFNDVAKPIIDYVCTICKSRNIDIQTHFTSNGYLLNEDILDFLRDKDVSFQITLDGCKDEHNKTRFNRNGTGSYDRIISNVKKLAQLNKYVVLRINYTSANIFNISNILNDLVDLSEEYRNNITIDFQRVWQDVEAKSNSDVNKSLDHNIRIFINHGFKVTSHKNLSHVSDSCYGDKHNHCLINYNGDVFNCTARDFVTENRSGYLTADGTIIWDNDFMARRMTSKYSKPVCHNCRIAPLCGGGCRQKAIEDIDNNQCTLYYSEKDIDQIILSRFEYSFLSKD